ncbi:MAG: phage head closure protein [Chloroflexota bacterium]
MQTGRLRERIQLQKQTITVLASGYEEETFTTFYTCWASVRSGRSGERFRIQADQEQATITHTVRIRYKDELYPTQRILWGTRVLDVHSIIDPDGKNHEMVFLCEEIMAGEAITPTYPMPAAVPLASDGFGTSFGVTDGLGHTGTPAGGGLNWSTHSGAWGINNGAARSTSTPGRATVDVSTPDVLIDANLTRGSGHAGIVARYVDVDNYIYCYHDGTNAVAIRRLAGVESTLVAAVVTYVAGATMRMIVDETDTLTLIYNGASVGTSSALGGLAGTRHGIYGTSGTSEVDNFAVFRSSDLGSV